MLHISMQALKLFEKLREQPEYNTPELWRRMTACQQAMGNDKGAVDMHRNILDSMHLEPLCGVHNLRRTKSCRTHLHHLIMIQLHVELAVRYTRYFLL